MGTDVIISAKEGSQSAMRLILMNFEPLIRHVAGNRETGVYYDDYLQAGRLGLFRAVQKTDPKVKGSFSSYATHHIRNEMALLS